MIRTPKTLLGIFTIMAFLALPCANASEQIIPHSVESFLKLCENTLSKECQGQVALALDALETTGAMLYSTGVRTTERSVCFKERENYETAITKIVEEIRKKSYPPNHMAYAVIIEAAGELYRCDPHGTLVPLNPNTASQENLNGKASSLKLEAGGVKSTDKAPADLPQTGVAERYLCRTGKKAFFTQQPNQPDCQSKKLNDGWRNIYFSKDYIVDYYREGLVRTGNQVKVWSRHSFSTPRKLDGQGGMMFDEFKTMPTFNCADRDYKNTSEFIYTLQGKEVLRTMDNQTDRMGIKYFDGKVNQIEPGSLTEFLFKEVCYNGRAS